MTLRISLPNFFLTSIVLTLLIACAGNPGEQTDKTNEEGVEKSLTGEHTPAIHTQSFKYMVGSQEHKGYMAWDTALQGQRPGILVVHEWWGHNDYAQRRARMLAELGYTALALDMFGEGKVAEHPDQAVAFMQAAMENAKRMQERFTIALDILKAHPTVNPDHIAAFGYCMGGTIALEMARAGVDLDGVVTFHSGLGTENPADTSMHVRILAFCGAEDPMIPAEAVEGFKAEMQSAGADFKVVVFPGAKHAFSNPAADSLGQKFGLPLAYQGAADTTSWIESQDFLDKLF